MAGQPFPSDSYAGYFYGNAVNLYGGVYNGAYQSQGTYEERSCWRKLYDYQSGYWYYQNLLTNNTQWEQPEGWDSWPINGEIGQNQSNDDDDDGEKSGCSFFCQTSEEVETKNTEYVKRKARQQVDPEKAKKIHWRPEGANEYNIWYDKWIGDHWKGTRDDGEWITRIFGCSKKRYID